VAEAFCPRCGTARIGSFRFCRSCGFDFDADPTSQASAGMPMASPAAAPPAAQPVPATPTAASPSPASATTKPGPDLRIGIALIAVIAVVIGGLLLLSRGSGGAASVPVTNQPPAGSIWFGTAFDPGTFALTGRGTSFPIGQIALVVHLSRPSRGENIGLMIINPVVDIPQPAGGGNLAAGDDLLAQLEPALYFPVAGTYHVVVLDAGGNQLAAGDVTIH
jgi:hypothetical protein